MSYQDKLRKGTIEHIVPNLRRRWPKELEHLSDNDLAELYEHFSQSEDHGNNDAKFLSWVQ